MKMVQTHRPTLKMKRITNENTKTPAHDNGNRKRDAGPTKPTNVGVNRANRPTPITKTIANAKTPAHGNDNRKRKDELTAVEREGMDGRQW